MIEGKHEFLSLDDAIEVCAVKQWTDPLVLLRAVANGRDIGDFAVLMMAPNAAIYHMRYHADKQQVELWFLMR